MNDQWKDLASGEILEWDLRGAGSIVQDSTLFPNWYFACEVRKILRPT